MIYKDGEKYNIDNNSAKKGDPCMKDLRDAFPDYFNKNIPLKVKVTDRKSKVVVKKENNRPFRRFADVHISSEAMGRYRGLTCQWKFIQTPVKIGDELFDQNGGFSLKNNDRLIPGRDDEKLFWLWFISREVRDNAVPDEIKKAQWKIYIEERSKVKQQENIGLKEQSRISAIIWDMEEDKMREVAEALFISHAKSKGYEELANDVYKKVLGPEKEKYIPEFKKLIDKDYQVITQIRSLVQKAEDLEIIKRDKSSKQWLILEEGTEEYVPLVGYTSEREASRTFSTYVAKDPNLLYSLKDRVNLAAE